MPKKTKFWIAVGVIVLVAALGSWYIVANDLPWSQEPTVIESDK